MVNGSVFCSNCGTALVRTEAGFAPAAATTIRKKTKKPVKILIGIGLVLVLLAAVWLIAARAGNKNVFPYCEDMIIINSESDVPAMPGDPGGAAAVDTGVPQTGGAALSTSERPGTEDFLWYTEGVYYDGLPEGVEPITDFNALAGSWKAFFWYDPDNTVNSYALEFLNISIAGEATAVTLTLDWYKMFAGDSYEENDYTSNEDSVLSGTYAEGGITAGEPGYTMHIYGFYTLYGKQYAIGSLELESGEPTFVAMVRP
jgi:hypothetical protein